MSPVTVMGEELPEPVTGELPDTAQLAVYEMMALPPLDVGAVNATVACPSPAVGVPMVGAPGMPPVIPNVHKTVAATA